MQQALLCSLFAALVFSGWGFITRTNPRGGLRVMRKTALLKTASTDVLVTTDLNTASTGQITELKRQLFGIGAQTDRGQFATLVEQDKAQDVITQLEALNPAYKNEDFTALGSWELVYTDAQPFSSSPFFLTLRELFGEDSQRADMALGLHRAATSTGQIAKIRQIIKSDELISEIDLKVGTFPGIPFSLQGTVISTANVEFENRFTMNLRMKSTSVVNSNLLSFLDDMNIALPIGKIYETVQGGIPVVKLTHFYMDDDTRITRTRDDKVFVYIRSS